MSVIKETLSNSHVVQLLPPTLIKANKSDITAIDLSGWNSALFMALIGNSGDALSSSLAIKISLQSSDDKTNFMPITTQEILQRGGKEQSLLAHIKAKPDARTCFIAAYIGPKSYVKPVITLTGNHSKGTIISIAAILQDSRYLPVA